MAGGFPGPERRLAVARRPRSFSWARRRRLLAAWARRNGLYRPSPPARTRRPRSFGWARRGVLAATLLAVALVPYPVADSASVPPSGACHGPCRHAGSAGKVLWAAALPGQWTTSAGLAGTVPVSGQAYAALGDGIAVVGAGMRVRGYGSRTGRTLWDATLTGFPADASIVSVRAWPGIVTVGVSYGPDAASRAEVIFASATGRQIRWYNAAPFGGAVAASPQTTVIVGATAVTAYANRTGAVRWSRPTGPAAQAWQVNGPDLYVTEAAGGYLGSAPATALRRIDLGNGLESVIRPAAPAFPGSLGGVAGDVVLFSAATGVTAFDGLTGLKLWSLAGAVPEGTDPAQDRFYLTEGTTLIGVDPLTGHVLATVSGSAVAGSAGMFAVRDGVALGLDQGPNGEAWGYDVRLQRVTWTTPGLPWPHYFVDIGGIGGSAQPDGGTVIVADCAKLAPAPLPSPPGSSGPVPSGSASPSATSSGTSAGAGPSPSPSRSGQLCQRPELIAISR
jgi:PQQ-like domain